MPKGDRKRKAEDGKSESKDAGSSSGRGMSADPFFLPKTLGNQGMLAMMDEEEEEKAESESDESDADRGSVDLADSKKVKKQRTSAYQPGMHGYKKKEQGRLSDAYDIDVTGDSHESEHTIGFEPLNQTSGNKRGGNSQARRLENIAPAYQEMKELHRDHIGTGTQIAKDDSGFNSEGYRSSQRSLVEDGDVSSAVQLNQLGYAFDAKKSKLSSTKDGEAATDSFDTMVTNMESVTYASGDEEKSVGVDAKQRAEMYLSRRAAITGEFPTVEEENEAREKFGLDQLPDDKKMKE